MDEQFDFVIIGAGAAGEAATYMARARGASVAIVDRALFGGSCAFWACIPSKTLLHAAAVHAGGGDYDWQRASARRDPHAAALRSGQTRAASPPDPRSRPARSTATESRRPPERPAGACAAPPPDPRSVPFSSCPNPREADSGHEMERIAKSHHTGRARGSSTGFLSGTQDGGRNRAGPGSFR